MRSKRIVARSQRNYPSTQADQPANWLYRTPPIKMLNVKMSLSDLRLTSYVTLLREAALRLALRRTKPNIPAASKRTLEGSGTAWMVVV